MSEITRRDFLKTSARLAALMGLGAASVPRIAKALNGLADGTMQILWLQAQSCSGCSVSLLNTEDPPISELITKYSSLVFHSTVSTATGETAMQVVDDAVKQGGYVLAVEGAIPAKMPHACRLGERDFADILREAESRAQAVVAVGACAAFGGIPGAEQNPTGAVGVREFLQAHGGTKPVIAIPGCPVHPDWLVGTIVHVLEFGLPELDKHGRPAMFFNRNLHAQCPRFNDYERENFAKTFGEDACYFKLGCLGPNTQADCPLRQWNGGENFCIRAGAPCIGCASPDFALRASLPFYTKKRATEN